MLRTPTLTTTYYVLIDPPEPPAMKAEVTAGVEFLYRMIVKNGCFRGEEEGGAVVRDKFKQLMKEKLLEKYTGHWYPQTPDRGLGYRCIFSSRYFPKYSMIEKVANECGIAYKDLGLPLDFTIWIDPGRVSGRFMGVSRTSFTVAIVSRHGQIVYNPNIDIPEVKPDDVVEIGADHDAGHDSSDSD